MSFAILHMQKLKQPAIKGIQIHNQREKESQTNGDIDESRIHLNYDLVNGSNVDYSEKVNQRIEEGVTTGKAIRKDAVRVASFLVTSDTEFFDKLSESDEKRFFESAYEFFCDQYGEENIAYSMVHKDEKTPHMHVGFVPITEDGRLSAKDFFGKKHQLVQLQDKFHKHISEAGFDLERGVSSDRKHVESAKYKALTFQKMEKEAQEKYEHTMGHIQQIDDKTKTIESIEPKKALGLVGMKEHDYESLVQYAKVGVASQMQIETLQSELAKAEEQIGELKSNLKIGQDKIRNYYQDIEMENEQVKKGLDALAEQKANEKVKELDITKKVLEIEHDYNELVGKYNEMLETKNQTISKLKQNIGELEFEKRSYQTENRELKSENESLREKVQEVMKEFSAVKEKLKDALDYQFNRIKTWLKINDVDSEKLKSLDGKREKLVGDSLERVLQTNNKENEMER